MMIVQWHKSILCVKLHSMLICMLHCRYNVGPLPFFAAQYLMTIMMRRIPKPQPLQFCMNSLFTGISFLLYLLLTYNQLMITLLPFSSTTKVIDPNIAYFALLLVFLILFLLSKSCNVIVKVT